MASLHLMATTTKHSAQSTKTISVVPPPILTSQMDSITTTTTFVPTKKVLVPMGYGTEEMEAVIIVDVLRRAGADVTVASME
ncbi:hypothetical protein F8388_002979 [Cannabis sativa]|uniref:DJ-1/PfpI domain-containing protein n=1 Tax=Cannabis sativa TaxID=3483 RepID=A0A7J6H488_CANSA|nr:hypothetical protein F8388_002979 [Cannabis sativa]